MESSTPRETTLTPPKTRFPESLGGLWHRFESTVNVPPPVPAGVPRPSHDMSFDMPAVHSSTWDGRSSDMPVEDSFFRVPPLPQGRPNDMVVEEGVLHRDGVSNDIPVDEGSVPWDGMSNAMSVNRCTFQVPPLWQGMCNEAPVEDGVFSEQLFHIQNQITYMLQKQDKLQAVVGKVCDGVDTLLAQDPTATGYHSDLAASARCRSSRRSSHTVLPHQRQFLKEKSRSAVVADEGVLVKAGRQRDSLGSDRSSKTLQTSVSEELVAEEEFVTERAPPSRNLFADRRATQHDDLCMLHELFQAAEIANTSDEQLDSRGNKLQYYLSLWRSVDRQNVEAVMESVIGGVILLNAIFIGFSMDNSDGDQSVWMTIDACFSALFLLELGLKIAMNGFCELFCGSSRVWRWFDASLIFIDLVQLVLVTALRDESGLDNTPSASLFRMVRLGKLARILRLLKHAIFNDLLAMLQGLLGGMTTLGWAMVLFIAVIYLVALLFREFFGKADVPNVSDLFSSVPRAMFTTFRCSFGDCSAPSGVPIFEHVITEYGALSGLCYCLFVFVVTIGLFNVISAIFLQSTLAASTALQVQKKKNRLRDYTLWCTNVAKLVRLLMAISNRHCQSYHENSEAKLTDVLQEVYHLEVPCSDIDVLVQHPEAIAALTALDIVAEDRDYLSDILDPDCGGTINVIELVEGLRRLRGDPRRSDIVTLNLMIRSVHKDVEDIADTLSTIKAASRD